LTGKTLFDGESVASLAAQHIYVAPPSLSDASPEPISPEFEALIMRCLAKSPAQRPASAAQIREALLACREMSERCAIERRVERSATDKQFESLMFTVPDPMLWRELPAAGLAA
jgi:serine/threonine-protein kinase